MTDQELWKRRFHVFAAVRLTGLAVFFLGVALAFTDLAREGGWPAVGGIVAIIGAIEAIFAPRLLKKVWETQDR